MSYHVLQLSPGQDTAGIGYRLAEALMSEVPALAPYHHPGGRDVKPVVAMRSTETYLQFPHDREWSWEDAKTLCNEASLIHIHNHVRISGLTKYLEAKPLVIHHHGTIFREEETQAMLDAADEFKAVTVVSTLDLTIFRGDLRWLPSPIAVDWMASLRAKYYEPSEKIRIVHAPTNRAVKDTALFIETIRELKAEGLPVEGMVIEGMPWSDCLKMKARNADIFYDQIQLGYGQNALESWAMGVPVVAGASEDYERIFRDHLGRLPYVHADAGSLKATLRRLVLDESARREAAAIGHEYVQTWHAYRPVAVLALQTYEEAHKLKGIPFPESLSSFAWDAPSVAETVAEAISTTSSRPIS